MNEWWLRLPTLLDHVWLRLVRGVVDRKADARHPTLATAGNGGAEARIVVLRAAERAPARVMIYTDLRSAKVKDLLQNPKASLLIWEQKAKLQIRLRVQVQIQSGEAVDAQWQTVPDMARKVYGNMPPPGTPMDDPAQLIGDTDRNAFAVLICQITEIETLYLGPDLHRRARFSAVDGWVGQWLSP